MAKAKAQRVDGLAADDLKKLHAAVRKVWNWSYAKRLCIARATGPSGFAVCEKCGLTVPKISVDHIVPVGSLRDPSFLDRLFCPSSGLQGLCKKCHAEKTKLERALARLDAEE